MSIAMTSAEVTKWAENIAVNGWPWSEVVWAFNLSLLAIWLVPLLLFLWSILAPALTYMASATARVRNLGSVMFVFALATWVFGAAAYYALFCSKGPTTYFAYNILGPKGFVEYGEFFYTYLTFLGIFTW